MKTFKYIALILFISFNYLNGYAQNKTTDLYFFFESRVSACSDIDLTFFVSPIFVCQNQPYKVNANYMNELDNELLNSWKSYLKNLIKTQYPEYQQNNCVSKVDSWTFFVRDASSRQVIDEIYSYKKNKIQTNYNFNGCPSISISESKIEENVNSTSTNENQNSVSSIPNYSKNRDAMLLKHSADLAVALTNAFQNRKTTENRIWKNPSGEYHSGTTVYKGNGSVSKYTGIHYVSEDESLEKIIEVKKYSENGKMEYFYSTRDNRIPIYETYIPVRQITKFYPLDYSERYIKENTFENLSIKESSMYDSKGKKANFKEFYDNGQIKYSFNFNYFSNRANKIQLFENYTYEAYYKNGKRLFLFSTDKDGYIKNKSISLLDDQGNIKDKMNLTEKELDNFRKEGYYYLKKIVNEKLKKEIKNSNVLLFDIDLEKQSYYLRKSNEANNNGKFEECAKNLIKAYQYGARETIILYYIAASYINAENYKEALKYYLLVEENDFESLSQKEKNQVIKNIALIKNNN
ncbi:hypothetical protein ACFSQJ_08955 [Croceitalea marina]|uniref:Tetratricopeptide repeat protein n=1 Tax=Croceitalea marina TaxID=1775166 RepID=A0ABW5MXJ0_9FLAO